MNETSLPLGVSVNRVSPVVAALRLVWLDGAELNAEKFDMGHLWIDIRTVEETTNKVMAYYSQLRDKEAIRAALMEYFGQLKLEMN